MKRRSGAVVLALSSIFAAACGGPNPSTPEPVPTPVVRATPTPVPTPTPTPAAIACSAPAPPPLYSYRVKVQIDSGFKKTLDSRAMVKGASYCAALGYPGEICVVRNEEATDAVTCGNLVSGVASQTGRYGPNWFYNDTPCRGVGEGGDAAGCKQHPTNQYFVLAFGPGVYSACGDQDRVCHGIEID